MLIDVMKLSKHSFTTICAEINSSYMNYLYLNFITKFLHIFHSTFY